MPDFYISSTKYSIHERQTKKHGKMYDIVFRIIAKDGTAKQKKLSGFSTKAACKEAYTAFVTEHCELAKTAPIKKQASNKASAPLVGDLVEAYFRAMPAECKESTVYDRKLIFEQFILPRYEKSKITDLTKKELYSWQTDLWLMKNPKTGRDYSYAYRSKARGYFSSFFTWCQNVYDIPNPFSDIKKPKRRAPKTPMKFWTRDEFDQFIAVVDDPMYRCLFSMMFFTGRRKGEILALTPEDVADDYIVFSKNISRKTLDDVAYRITSTKAEKIKKTPLCPAMRTILANYTGDRPFFFGGDKPLSLTTISRNFDKYIRLSGVKKIRIHDLRHSFVSLLIHNGANLTVVADLISDTLEQVTKTYAHMYDGDELAVLSNIK